MLVANLLTDKGNRVATVKPGDLVSTATQMLKSERVGALVVSEDGTSIAGIISERDIVRSLADDKDVQSRTISTIMTSNVITCKTGDDVGELMKLMTEHRIRHIPVAESGNMIGIVSIGDVVKLRLSELESEADAMRAYIATG